MKLLSIIVPAYNVEKYLNKLLDTLLENSSIVDVLEIIIVNDGSNDRTINIANAYRDRYKETVFVVDKENGGHGSGINVGIEMATGLYLKVIDSDDWVENKGLTQLVDTIEKTTVDLIVSPFAMIWENGTTKVENYRLIAKNKEVSFTELNQNNYIIPLHGFTIKTQIIKDNRVSIDEKIFYDDIEFIAYYVPFVNSILFLADVLYCYRLGRPGQSVEMGSYVKNVHHFEKMFDSICIYYFNNISMEEEKRKYYEHIVYNMLSKLCDIYLCIGDKTSKSKMKNIFIRYHYINFKEMKSGKVRLLRVAGSLSFGILSRYIRGKYSYGHPAD